MGDELREVIKGYLAKLEEDGSTFSLASAQKTASEGANNEPFFWLKALRWCPRELLDLVNSKACRGMLGALHIVFRLNRDACQERSCSTTL